MIALEKASLAIVVVGGDTVVEVATGSAGGGELPALLFSLELT